MKPFRLLLLLLPCSSALVMRHIAPVHARGRAAAQLCAPSSDDDDQSDIFASLAARKVSLKAEGKQCAQRWRDAKCASSAAAVDDWVRRLALEGGRGRGARGRYVSPAERG